MTGSHLVSGGNQDADGDAQLVKLQSSKIEDQQKVKSVCLFVCLLTAAD